MWYKVIFSMKQRGTTGSRVWKEPYTTECGSSEGAGWEWDKRTFVETVTHYENFEAENDIAARKEARKIREEFKSRIEWEINLGRVWGVRISKVIRFDDDNPLKRHLSE